ncbi:MAG: XrtA/PEP-CTERM system amidotransferase [Geminicoccaceae bacterium]
MCGLVGVLDLRGMRPIGRERIRRMTAAVRHRGPDGEGIHLEPGLGLGHRRLAVIDLAGGAQPMAGPEGRLRLVYNGEIYNYRELRTDLVARGHRFATRSDTEVLLAAYAQWGAGCVERLRGMFAFAIWDARERRLFLARDRLGEKPLYHATTADGLLLFGSEIGAVLAGMDTSPPLEPEAVADYLAYGYVPDPRSIYRGVHKLAPGHVLELRVGSGGPALRRYWRPDFSGEPHRGRTEDLARELAWRLAEAVRLRLVADVPLGAFLSGGVDSSGVVALMAQVGNGPVTTCSIGFGDPAFDETHHARNVAERYGTRHHEERVEVEAPATLLGELARLYGEPFADSSALPTWIVSRMARRHVTVALTGDGGDEVFAGYRRYPLLVREEAVRARLPAGLRHSVFGPLARLYPKLDWAPRPLRAKATFESLATDTAGGHLRAVTALPGAGRGGLLSPDFLAALGGYDPASVVARHLAEAGTTDPLARAQYVDLMTWLPGRMLVKVDRASMAHGLELRPPLLDHELIEWATRLPAASKLQGMAGKIVLKQALRPHLPPELLHRRKQGFTLPLAGWLRRELRPNLEALCQGGALVDIGLFRRQGLRRLVAEHSAGLRDHTPVLWALMMFDGFLASRPQASAMPVDRMTAA